MTIIFFTQGFSMKIYAIDNGRVSPHVKDPNFNQYLPVIPSELSTVNFTWQSGLKKYRYNFDRLLSLDESILQSPKISIKTEGRIPRKPKGEILFVDKSVCMRWWDQSLSTEFSVILPCAGNASGIAMFSIGLSIENNKGQPIPGTPLRLNLRKECATRGKTSHLAPLQGSVWHLSIWEKFKIKKKLTLFVDKTVGKFGQRIKLYKKFCPGVSRLWNN
jgi:WNT inhibitory factor 1